MSKALRCGFAPLPRNECQPGKNRPGDFHPDKVEIVFVKPYVFAAGGYGIGLLRGIVHDLAGVEEDADVAFVFEMPRLRMIVGVGGSTRKESKA